MPLNRAETDKKTRTDLQRGQTPREHVFAVTGRDGSEGQVEIQDQPLGSPESVRHIIPPQELSTMISRSRRSSSSSSSKSSTGDGDIPGLSSSEIYKPSLEVEDLPYGRSSFGMSRANTQFVTRNSQLPTSLSPPPRRPSVGSPYHSSSSFSLPPPITTRVRYASNPQSSHDAKYGGLTSVLKV